ncbi:hypothetical protein [Raineyella fluvialis]|uniref:ABC-2 type transport system permease protein n=1 Tax=Raineyella fluvialis TaxID=2662261 RepID=A0A5Q2FHV9_9ACTN|nr:hypothetical protein [Raineyella fluvialis]QGF24753.1 hypothetical protein Rai3103_15205 [Raineyella fluvialis]
MTPIVALTRIQLWGLLVGMGGRTRTRRRWSVAALVSIVSLATLGLSGVYSFGLATLLGRVGAADLVLVIMPALAAFGAISAGTFGVSRSVLGGRDDTLLLSLPLHPRTIALAKLAAVALQNALLLVLVTVPAGLAYAGQVAVPGWFWPVLLAGALVLALGVTGLSMALALLITLVAPGVVDARWSTWSSSSPRWRSRWPRSPPPSGSAPCWHPTRPRSAKPCARGPGDSWPCGMSPSTGRPVPRPCSWPSASSRSSPSRGWCR